MMSVIGHEMLKVLSNAFKAAIAAASGSVLQCEDLVARLISEK